MERTFVVAVIRRISIFVGELFVTRYALGGAWALYLFTAAVEFI